MFSRTSFGLRRDVEAADGGAAGGGRQQAAQDADGGRLPRPVGPQKAEDLAARDVERNIVDRHEIAEAFDQILDADGGPLFADGP